MAEPMVRVFSENSPAQIAYKLMQDIALCEGRKLNPKGKDTANSSVTGEWLLATYAQCLMTVRRPGAVSEHLKIDIGELEEGLNE